MWVAAAILALAGCRTPTADLAPPPDTAAIPRESAAPAITAAPTVTAEPTASAAPPKGMVTCLSSIASRPGDKPGTTIVYFTLPKGQTLPKGATLRCAPPSRSDPCTVLDIVDGGMIEALCPH